MMVDIPEGLIEDQAFRAIEALFEQDLRTLSLPLLLNMEDRLETLIIRVTKAKLKGAA